MSSASLSPSAEPAAVPGKTETLFTAATIVAGVSSNRNMRAADWPSVKFQSTPFSEGGLWYSQ